MSEPTTTSAYVSRDEFVCSVCPTLVDLDTATLEERQDLADAIQRGDVRPPGAHPHIHDAEYYATFDPTREFRLWVAQGMYDWLAREWLEHGLSERILDALKEAAKGRATQAEARAAVGQIIKEAEVRAAQMPATALLSPGLTSGRTLERLDAADEGTGALGLAVQWGLMDLGDALDAVRDIGSAAELSDEQVDEFRAKLRGTSTHDLADLLSTIERSVVVEAAIAQGIDYETFDDLNDIAVAVGMADKDEMLDREAIEDPTYKTLYGRFRALLEAQAEEWAAGYCVERSRITIDKLLAWRDVREIMKMCPTKAGDPFKTKLCCAHRSIDIVLIDENPPLEVAKCRDCDYRGTKWDLIETASGNSYTDDPHALLEWMKRTLLDSSTSAQPMRQRIKTLSDFITSTPPKEWRVGGVVLVGDSMFFGLSAAGKSFVIAGMGLCTAAGIPWHGHKVKRAKVCFVVGEGQEGFAQRLAAACDYFGIDAHSLGDWLYVLPCPIDLYDPNADAREFVATVNGLGCEVVILDTLATAMGAGNPNDFKDVNIIMANARCILGDKWFVHHARRDGSDFSGAENLKGSLDTQIEVAMTDTKRKIVRLSSKKQKDAVDFEPISFRITSHGKSAVLVPTSATSSTRPHLTPSQRKVLSQLPPAGSTPVSPADLKAATGVGESTARRVLTDLVKRGFAQKVGHGRYTAVDEEEAYLEMATAMLDAE